MFYGLEPASYGKRFFAYLADIIPISILSFAIGYMIFDYRELAKAAATEGDSMDFALRYTFARWATRQIGYALWIAYSTMMESSKWQGSIGKRLLGLQVVDLDGNPPGWKKALLRNLFKFLGFFLLLSVIWTRLRGSRHPIHDRLSGTMIVSR